MRPSRNWRKRLPTIRGFSLGRGRGGLIRAAEDLAQDLAQQAGVTQLADGVGMLAEQAAEAFAWWRGVRPDTAAVIAKLTVPLV